MFGVVVAVFWAVPHVSALNYQEQFQLFLTNSSYFLERVAVPGGLADYISEFLVQFNYVPFLGAAIIAALYVGIQGTVWRLMRQMGASKNAVTYLLSFLPSVLLWWHMGDVNVMMTLPVAVLGALLASTLMPKGNTRFSFLYPLFSIILYWLVGMAVWVFVVLTLANILRKERSTKTFGYAIAILILTLAWILFTAQYIPYPLDHIFRGLNYYRYSTILPVMQVIIMAAACVVPILGCLRMPASVGNLCRNTWCQVAVYAVGILLTIVGLRQFYDEKVHELIDYDFLTRTERWDKIITKAEQKLPTSPMGVSIVNLALSQQGQLLDRLFEFYQNGGEGLFPSFRREMTSPVPTAEIFWHLGMVNSAERYMFEAQEAIPNFRKSARLTRRIAECELVNGNYQVARKLLRRLENTLFYRSWAERTLALCGDEAAINNHPVYGKLRRLRQQQDYLFSDTEMDQMLGLLFTHSKENKMAYEYMVSYVLLQRNLDKFMNYYALGRYVQYDHIPRTIQEVLIGHWMQTHNDPRTMPYSVDGQTVNNTLGFIQTYMKNPNDPQLNQPPYVSNAWHYLTAKANKQ